MNHSVITTHIRSVLLPVAHTYHARGDPAHPACGPPGYGPPGTGPPVVRTPPYRLRDGPQKQEFVLCFFLVTTPDRRI